MQNITVQVSTAKPKRQEIAEDTARGFPSRGLIGGSEGWNFPVKTSAISNVRVRRRYMVPRMIRVVTHPLGLPQQKTAPRATPGRPMPGNANLFFSARLGFKCHPLFPPSPSLSPSLSLSVYSNPFYLSSSSSSFVPSAPPLRGRLPFPPISPSTTLIFHPSPLALFVLSMGQLRQRRNPSFAASPALFVVAAYSIYCSASLSRRKETGAE